MNAILIPVKEFHEAKKRLAPHLPAASRAALAQAMCADIFRIVSESSCAERVFVISKEPWALTRARDLGWETIVESHQASESASVDAASHYCAARGIRALLRLPIDIPLAQPQDIDAVFAQLDGYVDAVMVPSGDGTGTNAILRSPPCLFPSRFGPGSFSLHLAEADQCGARLRIHRNPRLELDIDELEDLKNVSNQVPRDSAIFEWFAAGGLTVARPASANP
jgi:2-phospho-L-lactate guanylyltransferase